MPDWLATNAAPIFTQMLLKTGNKIDGAIAANDNIAGAVIAVLKSKHLQPIALSGQDASPAGVQQILAGWQTNDRLQVRARRGQCGSGSGDRHPPAQEDPRHQRVPEERLEEGADGSLPVVSITKANYKRLFTDGWLKPSQVCVGVYKQYCK